MGILDKATVFGRESTYETLATFTDGFEAMADGSELERTVIERPGWRQGQQARRAPKMVPAGGIGQLKYQPENKGFGFLMEGMLGSIAGPTQEAASTAYKTTAVTTADGPSVSYSAQVQKPDADGTVTPFTHLGCVFTDWELNHPLDGNLEFMANWVSASVNTSESVATAVYPANADTFDWGMAGYTINGGSFRCVNSFNLKTDLGFKTDRRCQRQNRNRKQAVRTGLPAFTGEINLEYIGNDLYDLYYADTEFEIVAHWLGEEIETGHNYELKITMPHCKIVGGATPQNETGGDIPMQKIPFEAFHGTSPTMTMEYISTDTSL